MTVAEKIETRQGSNGDLSVVQVSTMFENNERPDDDATESDSQTNRDSGTEVNTLLLVGNHNPQVEPKVSNNVHEERNDSKKFANHKNIERGDTASNEPPDGGWRAWSILVGSFLINGILFSIINTYSLIYLQLQAKMEKSGDVDASSKAALVGSLTIGTTFFFSPISSILTEKIGIQLTTFLGGAIAATGMLLSSMVTEKVEILYLTYSILYGLGASLAYTPSLVILGHYFKRYLGLVNGIVTMGSSIFTILLPYLLDVLLAKVGLEGTLRCLAGLVAIIMFCALLFKPISFNNTEVEPPKARCFKAKLKKAVNVSVWRHKKFVIWSSAIPIALFGYFVPYVHIGKFVETRFTNNDNKLPILCIGITSGIGRLVFGYIADLPRVNRILLQQISFISIGFCTMLLPLTTNFIVLLVISLCMGLFDGCFISLLGPIAFDICGQAGATHAIGYLLGMCSIPLTVGPPIAGLIYDSTKSYTLPFILAGIPPLIGAMAMFLVRCVKDEKPENQVIQHDNPLANAAWKNGKAATKLHLYNETNGKQENSTGRSRCKNKSTFCNNSECLRRNACLFCNNIRVSQYRQNGKSSIGYSESDPLLVSSTRSFSISQFNKFM